MGGALSGAKESWRAVNEAERRGPKGRGSTRGGWREMPRPVQIKLRPCGAQNGGGTPRSLPTQPHPLPSPSYDAGRRTAELRRTCAPGLGLWGSRCSGSLDNTSCHSCTPSPPHTPHPGCVRQRHARTELGHKNSNSTGAGRTFWSTIVITESGSLWPQVNESSWVFEPTLNAQVPTVYG